MDAFLFFTGFALIIVAVGLLVGLAAIGIGIGDNISGTFKRNNAIPECKLSPEQKAHNAEVDADEGREDYIEPEHDWAKWEDVTARTDGHSTTHVQERHCLICGYREFRKQKIKY